MKIIFKMVVAFLLLFVTQVNATTFSSNYIGKYHYVESSGRWGDFEAFYRTDNKKTAYCIQPGVNKTTEEYEEYKGLDMSILASKVSLTKEKLAEISFYAYYGYGYTGHYDFAYYVAAQALIWNALGHSYQFTSQNNPSNPWAYVIDVPSEIKVKMNEILSLVQKHQQVLASLNGKHFEIAYNTSYSITDDNLRYAKLTDVNPEVVLNGNTLTITPRENGTKRVNLALKKEGTFRDDLIVYHHDKGQDLMQAGSVPTSFSFTYESYAGSIKLYKYDFETKSCQTVGQRVLDKALYAVFDENGKLFESLNIINCEASLDNIPVGKYYLKEVKAPYGYLLDGRGYFFEVTKDNANVTQEITVYDRAKTTLLKINKKYLAYHHMLLNEEGATFKIYSNTSHKEVGEITTDSLGNASIELPYDTYTLVQVKGKENYNFIPNETITVDDLTQEEVNLYLVNYPNYGSLHIKKYDADSKTCSSLGTASLEGAIYGLYLLDGTLVEKITFRDCEAKLDDLILGDYYLQEIKAPYGYELDLEKHYITLNNESFEITLYDKRKEVSLKIKKQYHYDTDSYLNEEKAVFEIYDKLTNKRVKMLTTDEKGEASTTLWYGKYIIKQVKGLANYEFIADEEFEINDDASDLSKTFINEPFKRKIHLVKVTKDTHKRIYLANIAFKIYDRERKKYICENEDCLYKTNLFGEFMTGNLFPSTYVIEEVKKKNDNLLYNPLKIEVKIGADSDEITFVSFENEVVTGKVIINKTNEKGEALTGVLFGLYAREDIYDVNKKIIYHQGEFISKGYTNEQGQIIFEDLPLGSYFVKELETLEGYLLSDEEYDIELLYQDEETPVILKELSLMNILVPNTKKESLLPLILLLGLSLKGWMVFYAKKKNASFPSFD